VINSRVLWGKTGSADQAAQGPSCRTGGNVPAGFGALLSRICSTAAFADEMPMGLKAGSRQGRPKGCADGACRIWRWSWDVDMISPAMRRPNLAGGSLSQGAIKPEKGKPRQKSWQGCAEKDDGAAFIDKMLR
jgi:hypothetical protein